MPGMMRKYTMLGALAMSVVALTGSVAVEGLKLNMIRTRSKLAKAKKSLFSLIFARSRNFPSRTLNMLGAQAAAAEPMVIMEERDMDLDGARVEWDLLNGAAASAPVAAAAVAPGYDAGTSRRKAYDNAAHQRAIELSNIDQLELAIARSEEEYLKNPALWSEEEQLQYALDMSAREARFAVAAAARAVPATARPVPATARPVPAAARAAPTAARAVSAEEKREYEELVREVENLVATEGMLTSQYNRAQKMEGRQQEMQQTLEMLSDNFYSQVNLLHAVDAFENKYKVKVTNRLLVVLVHNLRE